MTGPCDAGYYCTLGATRSDPQNDATGGTCPTGHYCPQGTGVPQGCPPGYFSNATGNVDFSGCKLCTEGKSIRHFNVKFGIFQVINNIKWTESEILYI